MAERRRILMTADTVGGVFGYALTLAGALAPDEVVLATMGGPISPAQARAVAERPNLRLVEGPFRLEWMEEPWDDVARAGEWLLGLAQAEHFDVVHLNQFAHGALPWPAPVVMVGHSDVVSWYRAVRGEEPPAKWDRYRQVVRRGLHGAAMVVAPSRTMLAALTTEYGPLAHACVVENGSDPTLFRRRPKRPFILAVGRLWDDAKNLQALESVAPKLAWPILVVGSCQHPDGAARAVTGVRALGTRSPGALAALYGEAAIYAHPARYEPFGLSVLEAALSGCALVLGDIRSLRELWDGAALFVPPDDSGALADAIEALIDDPSLRSQLASAASSRAAGRTPSRMAAAYRVLYDALGHATETACA